MTERPSRNQKHFTAETQRNREIMAHILSPLGNPCESAFIRGQFLLCVLCVSVEKSFQPGNVWRQQISYLFPRRICSCLIARWKNCIEIRLCLSHKSVEWFESVT
jgi:hypothetical protein